MGDSENIYGELTQLLTPEGFRSLKFLNDEYDGVFKVWTLCDGWLDVRATQITPDFQFYLTTAVLDNGFTNITGSRVDYLTAIDSEIDALGIQGRNLKAIHYLNSACNEYVRAAMVVALFSYSIQENAYYLIPQENRYYATDLMCVYEGDMSGRCDEFLYLQDHYRQEVLDVFGYYANAKAPKLPDNVEELSLYEKASLLRGFLTVYLDFNSTKELKFIIPTLSLSNGLSNLLTELGIEHEQRFRKAANVFDPLNPSQTSQNEYSIVIAPRNVPRFMTTVGITTECRVCFVWDISRVRSVKATTVTTQLYDRTKDIVYEIIPVDYNDYYCIVGGVYTKIQPIGYETGTPG